MIRLEAAEARRQQEKAATRAATLTFSVSVAAEVVLELLEWKNQNHPSLHPSPTAPRLRPHLHSPLKRASQVRRNHSPEAVGRCCVLSHAATPRVCSPPRPRHRNINTPTPRNTQTRRTEPTRHRGTTGSRPCRVITLFFHPSARSSLLSLPAVSKHRSPGAEREPRSLRSVRLQIAVPELTNETFDAAPRFLFRVTRTKSSRPLCRSRCRRAFPRELHARVPVTRSRCRRHDPSQVRPGLNHP